MIRTAPFLLALAIAAGTSLPLFAQDSKLTAKAVSFLTERRDLLRDAIALIESRRKTDVQSWMLFEQLAQLNRDLLDVELELCSEKPDRRKVYEGAIKKLREIEQRTAAQMSLEVHHAALPLAAKAERLAVEIRMQKEGDSPSKERIRTLVTERHATLDQLLNVFDENPGAGELSTFLAAHVKSHHELLAVELDSCEKPDDRVGAFEKMRKRLDDLEKKLRSQPDLDSVDSIHAEFTFAARLGVEIRMMKEDKETPTGLMHDMYWAQNRALGRAAGLLQKRGETNSAIVWILEQSAQIARAQLPNYLELSRTPAQRQSAYRHVRAAFDLWEYRANERKDAGPAALADYKRARAGRLEVELLMEKDSHQATPKK